MRLLQQAQQCVRCCLLLSSVHFAVAPGYAQPSGGPYGPIDQRYEIPKAAHVYFVAPDGKADSPGTTLEQPTVLPNSPSTAVPPRATMTLGRIKSICSCR